MLLLKTRNKYKWLQEIYKINEVTKIKEKLYISRYTKRKVLWRNTQKRNSIWCLWNFQWCCETEKYERSKSYRYSLLVNQLQTHLKSLDISPGHFAWKLQPKKNHPAWLYDNVQCSRAGIDREMGWHCYAGDAESADLIANIAASAPSIHREVLLLPAAKALQSQAGQEQQQQQQQQVDGQHAACQKYIGR